MKKMLCLSLVLSMILCLFAGCGSSNNPDSTPSVSVSPSVAEPSAAPEEIDASEESPVSTVESALEEAPSKPAHELPLTDEYVELSLFTGMNPNLMGVIGTYAENGFFQWMEEQTGVHVSIPAVHPATQSEKWNLMAASGDYTDFLGALGNYPGGMQGVLDDEIVYDLTTMKEYMPLFFDTLNVSEEVRRDCTLDSGSIPATYRIISNEEYYRWTNGPTVRADWLRELNLDIPTTFDEYHEVLTAFKNAYGATMWFSTSEFPYVGLGYNIRAGYTFGMGSDLDCWYVEDGIVKCGFLEDEFLDYMSMMQQWYREGLLDPDFFTVKCRFASNNPDEFSAVVGGKHGIWTEEAPSFAAYDGYEMEITAAPIPTKTGNETITVSNGFTRVDGSQFGVATSCVYPEIACEWLDYWYSDEATLAANWGTEDVTFTYDENGGKIFTDLILNNPNGLAMSFARELYCAPTGGYCFDHETIYALWSDNAFDAAEVWCDNVEPTNVLPSFLSMTTTENEEYSSLSGDLITYLSERLGQMIRGDINMDEGLEDFRSTIRNMGIERCMELKQAAYDRYEER